MSVTALPLPAARPSIRCLAVTEAQLYLRRVSVWVGWVLTTALIVTIFRSTGEWPGATYESLLPLSFGPLVLGVFVAGVRTGARDQRAELPGLAPEAALDLDDRLAGRLLGLATPALLAALTTAAIAVAARVEGGFWLGESIRRTDTAQFGPAELLQPALLVTLAGVLGVVAGRGRARVPLLIAGVFGWLVVFMIYWGFNSPLLHGVTPPQTMPLRVQLDPGVSIGDTPIGWFVEFDDYSDHYVRQVVHTPTVIAHDVYLLGLIVAVGAGVARQRTRLVRTVGLLTALVAVVVQYSVSPL